MISLKSERELEFMRKAGELTARILDEMCKRVAPGMTTGDLDRYAEARCKELGVIPVFKGYHVYRAEGDGEFQKIATLVEAPAYSDATAQKGKRYRYAVTAVDTSGNESARSNPQEAIIP